MMSICKEKKRKKQTRERFTLRKHTIYDSILAHDSPSLDLEAARNLLQDVAISQAKHHPRRARTTSYRLNCVKRGNRGSVQTSPIVRLSQQRHLFAIALVHVHVHPFQLEITTGRPRAGHKPEELRAILVPLHRVQFLPVQIVLASERHLFPSRVSYTRHVYPHQMDGRAWKRRFVQFFGIGESRGEVFEIWEKLEFGEPIFFFFFGIERIREVEFRFGSKNGILVMEDKS